MAVNRAENTIETRLVDRVAELESALRELKARQLVGADGIAVQTIPSTGYLTAGPLNLAAGAFGSFIVANKSALVRLTLWDFECGILIDGTDNSLNVMPNGALTTAQLKVERNDWVDWSNSDDAQNLRTYIVRLHNVDASAHDYYLRFRAYLPAAGGGSVVTPGLGGS